jgi:hypothetical protein
MENKPLKSLVLPNSSGENVNYILHPDWDNVENKPDSFPTDWNDISNKPEYSDTTWEQIKDIPNEFPTSWTLVSDCPNIMPSINEGIESDLSSAFGAYAVALGESLAQGDFAFAMGDQVMAYGNGASALGHMTIA